MHLLLLDPSRAVQPETSGFQTYNCRSEPFLSRAGNTGLSGRYWKFRSLKVNRASRVGLEQG